ncbi:MAG: glucan biosynthesis protein [Hyphomicrobiales bacterium]|nr:glucan biosynthesis protein [Hyphomicrobiales bacterium]
MAIDFTRRYALTSLGAACTLAALPVSAQQNGSITFPGPLGDGQRFSAMMVPDAARALAKRPMAPNPTDLPDGLGSLSMEAIGAIRMQPANWIWAGEQRGFSVEPLHRGGIFNNQVQIYVVEDGISRRIGFDKSRFDYGRTPVPTTTNDLGFSGFRLHFGNDRSLEAAVFQGATFFKAVAKGQMMGAVARSLVLRPGEQRGEEVPYFRGFWIERPGPAATTFTVHGLIDSESATAAVRMTLRPGDVTINDIELTVFARVQLDNVGFGGMMGNFLFAPQRRRVFDDVRPAVHEVSGLQMRTGAEEWVYRPLNNPEQLQVSAFIDQNPRGFGLVQRERDYGAFQDDDQRFELRPSVWIEPLGDWGAGTVQLLEVPTDSEINDNIIAHWRPRQPLPAGSETTVAYRQIWCWQPPEAPPVAIARLTRQGRGTGGRRRRFFVDFTGDMLADASLGQSVKVVLSATPGAILNMRFVHYPERRTMRVAFELDPGAESSCELRLQLEAGGKPISETWLNRWTP